jgi:hypothetical protein
MAVALVISAPRNKVNIEAPPFEQILTTGVGPGYAISDPDRRSISIGCTVVILDKQYRKRAEATIVRFELAGKTESGMQRYNVHFKDAQETDFRDERLERWGTSVIDF